VDRGLVSEKPEGLSAKSAISGPRVDFPKVQGPLCKISEISGITNYFLTDNSWTGSTSPWTGRACSVHRGPAGRARSGADNGHSGTLTKARPPAAPVHQSSPAGAQNGEGGTGSSIRASPRLERRRGGRATMGKARWCWRSVRGRLELLERENESGERCG
jgi:hypothetical protein